jgi:hypothetical protein
MILLSGHAWQRSGRPHAAMAAAIASLRLTSFPGHPPDCEQNGRKTQPMIGPLVAHRVTHHAWPLHHRQSLRRAARVHGPASLHGIAPQVAAR